MMFQLRPRFVVLTCIVSYGLAGSLFINSSAFADEASNSAATVYQQKCERCHGADGQGVAGTYEVPLAGQRSVGELTRLIERTMPEDKPGDCQGDEARQVARYIFDEFYSPAARIRKGLDPPVRVERMRLTVSQYRQTVADLIGAFTPDPAVAREANAQRDPASPRPGGADQSPAANAGEPPAAPQRGLRAFYYRSKGMSKADELALERVDGRIDFDFHEAAPLEGMPADQFSIVWDGALEASATGEYLFRITTPNGARLYLNNDPTRGLRKLRDDSSAAGQSALIDAWVSSGKVREESARVYLLGGRRYPIRLEFFKYMEPTASIRLEWKPPHGAWSPLDQQATCTADVGRTFVVETPFPADDRSQGYERGSSLSHEWQVATTQGAILAAAEIVDRLPLLAGEPVDNAVASDSHQTDANATQNATDAAEAARRAHLQEFVVRFATRAFRHPLAPEQMERLRTIPFAEGVAPELAVRRAIVWILCSPEFLFTDLTPQDAAPDDYAIAARLALTLWDSIPDATLWAAAEAGELHTSEQVTRQAERMLRDERARHKMRGFFQHWLELEERDLAKDKQMFPEFNEEVIADLRRSLDLFLDGVIWSDASDYRQLLSSEYLLLNDRLLRVYSVLDPQNSAVSDAAQPQVASTSSEATPEFRRVDLPSQERAGVLTHPYLLSVFAYHNNTSPIHRGVFLTRNIVGRALKPPPMAIAFKNDEFAPDLTMREKITQLTRDSNCMSCHSVINPLGFALEHYDAVGRWRVTENQKPVDSKSHYTTENGEPLEVSSARDISQLALSSESAQRIFVIQLFQHLTKQNPPAYGPTTIETLRSDFANDQYHVQHLMARIAVLAALHDSTAADGLTPASAVNRQPDVPANSNERATTALSNVTEADR